VDERQRGYDGGMGSEEKSSGLAFCGVWMGLRCMKGFVLEAARYTRCGTCGIPLVTAIIGVHQLTALA
jgi:hypothetical protein